MKIHVLNDAVQIGQLGADLVEARLRANPQPVLGVATGSSPLPIYRELASRRSPNNSFSKVRAFALDEYIGLDETHQESYHQVIDREVSIPLGLNADLVHVPSSHGRDEEAEAYEEAIRSVKGVDIQILGIGVNGHIGFNEPGSSPTSRTRIVKLTESTRLANARYFNGDLETVPTHAMTQGIATILAAKSIVLVALGSAKANAIVDALTTPPHRDNPASYLQLHEDVTVLLDSEAAQLLPSSAITQLDRG